ncbi:MAG: 6-bladed beta-propeller [Candidatus Aminicenantales bacterium]
MKKAAVWTVWLSLALLLAPPVLLSGATKTLWSVSSFGASDFLQEPSDLEVDGVRSLIYVVDAGTCRVLVFDFRGEFLRAIGRKGQGPGEFMRPTGMCLIKDGGIAVADFGSNRIQIFDAAGKFARSVTVTEARVADLVFTDGRFYTVPSFGASGYAVTMGSQDKSQPLVNVLDEQGKKILEISVADLPETQPFVRAIKHRVSLALSPAGRLYLPHFALNLVQIFEKTGEKVGDFSRPLPFKPVTPALIDQRSPEAGVVQMRADTDVVNAAARFGPDGKLYILTATESLAEGLKKAAGGRHPTSMRIDVIDPETREVVKTIACDPGIRAFGLMDGGRLLYISEDNEGELVLKCVQY